MKRTLGLLLVVAALSGCTNVAPDTAATAADADGPPTASDLLNATAHVRVDAPTTLEFSFQSASERVPRIATTLVHLATPVDVVNVEKDARPLLFALIPHGSAHEQTACDGLPPGTHADFRPMKSAGPDVALNLTDAYDAGWYHAVVVTDRPTTIRLTFGADGPVEPTPWRMDKTVAPAVRSLTSGHQVGVSLGGDGNPWLAWLVYGVDGAAIDAGGERLLRVGDGCAADKASVDDSSAGRGPGLAVSGNGSAPAAVLARYTPNQPAVAPETTTLTVVEITFKPLESSAATPSPAPTGTTVAA